MHLSSWSLFYYLKKKKWELIIKNRISSIRKSNNKLTGQFIQNVSVTPCFLVRLLLCLFLALFGVVFRILLLSIAAEMQTV